MRHKTIAMLDVPEQRAPTTSVFGAWVAAREAMEESIRHLAPVRVQIFVENDVDLRMNRLAAFARKHRWRHVRFAHLHSLAEADKNFRIDHWHDFMVGLRPFALRRGLGGEFPISICHHAISYSQQLHDLFLKLLLEDVQPWDSLVCASTASREAIERIFASIAEWFERKFRADISFRGRLDLVPFGVRTDLFRPGGKRAARKRYRLPQDAIVILWLGRISERDKADLLPLLRVFRRLRERNSRQRLLLVIAGAEYERGVQSAQIKHYARLLGIAQATRIITTVPPQDRHRLFAAADVFVSPADNPQETFGLAPIEAMSAGVPQVVADWDGYRDTVRHGETGFLIPTRWIKCDQKLERMGAAFDTDMLDHLYAAQSVAVDFDALEQHLQLLIERPELRMQMGKASRERALREYDWKIVIAKLQELWAEQGRIRRRLRRERKEFSRPHYTDTRLFDFFKDYASHLLTGNEVVVLTDEHERVSARSEPLPYYFAKRWQFDAAIYSAITIALERTAPMSILALERKFAGRFGSERVRQHLMWLLKYGYVRISSR